MDPAPIAKTKTEPPVKKTLAYQQALEQRDAEIDQKALTQKIDEAAELETTSPANGETSGGEQEATSQDGAPDLAALPDGAAAEPLPWANQQPAAPPPGGYPQQDAYGAPQPPGTNPYGQAPQGNPYARNDPGGQNPYAANAPGQNPYATNQPGSPPPGAYGRADPFAPPGDPYADPYGPPGQTAYPRQDGYDRDPGAPYGRHPYSGEPLGPDGQVASRGGADYPGHDAFAEPPPPYPGQALPPGQTRPPYPGQAPGQLQGQAPQGQAPQGQAYGPPEEWVRVIVSGTGMRSTATEDAPILFAFPYGRDLKVVQRNGDWVEVADPNSSAKGWMQSFNLAPSTNPATRYGRNPYYEEPPKKQTGGIFRNFIDRAFGN